MRISAAYGDGWAYRVYDYPAGKLRDDLVWVDDSVHMVGVGYAFCGQEWVFEVERRKRVLIIRALRWVALDLPEEEETAEKSVDCRTPDYVVVR